MAASDSIWRILAEKNATDGQTDGPTGKVAYGVVTTKTHQKMFIVVQRDPSLMATLKRVNLI